MGRFFFIPCGFKNWLVRGGAPIAAPFYRKLKTNIAMSKLLNYRQDAEVIYGPDDMDWDYAPMPEMEAMRADVDDLCLSFETLKRNLQAAAL